MSRDLFQEFQCFFYFHLEYPVSKMKKWGVRRVRMGARPDFSLATSYNNLALIYTDLKDYESAKTYGEKAVAIL